MANLRCKAGSTQVEEAVLIAAAIQGGIIGKGKTAGFVIELLQRSLIQRMVPVNAIKCGGGLSSDMLASSSQWNEGTAFGAWRRAPRQSEVAVTCCISHPQKSNSGAVGHNDDQDTKFG